MGISTGGRQKCFSSSNVDCDEHLCLYDQYSCGDGGCSTQETNRITVSLEDMNHICSNYRNLNYLCEIMKTGAFEYMWTIDGGYCMNFNLAYKAEKYDSVSNKDECAFLIKCAFTNGLDTSCVCDNDCEAQIESICPSEIQYPAEGNFITPYLIMKYHRDRYDWMQIIPDEYYVHGSIRCRGYQVITTVDQNICINDDKFLQINHIEERFCSIGLQFANQSGPQFPVSCWNESKTFDNFTYQHREVCSYRCFSQYRLRDGIIDCSSSKYEDEQLSLNHSCPTQQRYRLQCSTTELSCLLATKIGTGEDECSNEADEFSYETGHDLTTTCLCGKRNNAACIFLRTYIQQSSALPRGIYSHNSMEDTKLVTKIPFSYYCDSFFDTQSTFDESLDFCRDWICQQDKYRCLTGHFVSEELLCDGM